MDACDTTRLHGTVARRVRRTTSALAGRIWPLLVPTMLAVLLLGPGMARGQTTTATSAQDYVTAINAANNNAPATQIVINSPAGTTISLSSVTLPTLGSNSSLMIGNSTVDSPVAGGTLNNNGSLAFAPPTGVNDTINTAITGSGTVSQGLSGTLTFTDNGHNTYSGGTGLATSLFLGDSTTNTGTVGSGPVSGAGTLVFNEPSALTFANSITGGVSVTQNGPGTVTFTDNGNNAYSGGTTIAAAATLSLGDGTSHTGTLGSGNVSNNGALMFDEPSAVTLANNISGTGSVTQQYAAGVTLSGGNTYAGSTTIIGDSNAVIFQQQNGFGVLTFATTGALPNYLSSPSGTITLQQAGGLAVSYALDQTTLNAISSSSVGFVALGTDSTNDLDFTNLPRVSLGASGLGVTSAYSGNLTPTPPSDTSLSTTNYQYQVGGGNGFLVLNTGLGDFSDGEESSPTELDAVNNGFTILQGFNTFSGGMNVSLGVVELTSSQSYCSLNSDCQARQTAPPIQVAQTGILATGYALDQATLNAISPASSGTVALAADSSNDLDFTSLPNVSLGAVGNFVYSGNITPGINGYMLGGGGDFRVNSVLTATQLLSGPNALTVNGPGFDPGIVVLVNAETYTGNTTINGGQLQLGNGTINGTIANTPLVTIKNTSASSGFLVFDEATPITFANPITGPGNVLQTGVGSVTLTQSETYTGYTIIYGGTLALAAGSSIASSSSVSIGSNQPGNPAVLDMSQGGDQSVQNLQTFWFENTPGPVTAQVLLGGNTLTDNANAGATAIDAVISGTGSFVKQGPQQLTLANINTYSGGTTISDGTLVLGGAVSNAPSQTIGTVGSGPVTDNAALLFTEPGAVTLPNAISGTGTVTQDGPGTVTLSGTNTYSGGTTIAAETTLGLGGQATGAPAATVGTLGSGGVANSGTLVLTEPAAVTLPNLISGSGTVVQDGPGTVTLAAINAYTGGTTITAGTLALGSTTAVGGLGSGAVTDNGTLAFTEPSAVSFGNTISGSGSVIQSGPGTVMLTAINSYTGGTTIGSGATLMLGISTIGTVGSGAVTDNGTLVFSEPSAVTFGNAIDGTGGIEQIGPGTVTLTNANGYTGGTLIFSGTLALGSGGSIAGSGAVTLANVNGSGGFGVLDISAAGNQTINNLSSVWDASSGTTGASVVLGGNTLTVNTTVATVFDGVISGTGGLIKSNAATLTLAGTNSYSGGTTISGGTLALGGQASGASAATVGTLGSGPVTDNANLAFTEPTAVTFGNTISGTGTVMQAGPGTVTFNTTNNYSGGTTITAGTLALGGATVGTLGSGPVTDNGTLAFTQPSAVTFANVISGTGGVTQSGPGTITLDSPSTYTGLTEVKAGSLIVGSVAANGATVGGSVQVDPGATLAGYGSLGVTAAAPPTLLNNGTVIPGGVSGNAPGTMTVSGNYVQGGGGNLLIAVTPTQAAKLKVGGTATLAGTITFAYAPGTYVPTTYTVLTSTGAISTRFGTVAEQGSVPTELTRTVEYVANTPDPVLLVLSSPALLQPAAAHIFSEQLGSLAGLADSNAAAMLDGGAVNDCATAGVPPAPSEPGAPAKAAAGIAAIGRMLCDAGGWIHVDGTFRGVDSGGGNPSYHANTAGFLAGVDRPVGDGGLRLGIAAGYDHRWLTDSDGANATAEVARFGLYAIQPVGPMVLNAAFLYGRDWETTNRPSGIGTATAQYGGNEFSGGVRASMPMTLGGFTGVPMAGVRFASVGTGSFAETGSGALSGFGLSGASTSQLSVIPYARFILAHDCIMSSGIKVSPYAAVGYQYQAGDAQQAVLLTAADGTAFRIGSTSLDRSAATLGVGIAAGQGNWSAFASYGALVSGNWQEQEIDVGLRVSF